MTAAPRVTLVTPSFNQGRFLEATIRSVLDQNYPQLEYIVIDGGSTDDSIDIIRKYERQFADWVSEPDTGQANAINKGFRRGHGEIMGWLNSDDRLLPGTLWQIVRAFQRKAECQIVCGFRYIINAQNERVGCDVYPKPDGFSLARSCYLPQETVFWRRSVWERVGELDESFQFALDYEFWQRILAAGYNFCLIPQFISEYRIHPATKSESQADVRARELAKIYKRYLQTDLSEVELQKQISRAWWRRFYLLNTLAQKGFLHSLFLANILVNVLTLGERDIVNRSR